MKRTARQDLTVERLRELLRYDELTDQWERLGGRNIGKPVGIVTKSRRITVDGVQYLEARLRWLYTHGEWPQFIVLKNDSVETVSPTDKKCAKCCVIKPLDEFPKSPGCKWGRRGTCTECRSAETLEWKKRTGYKAKPKEPKLRKPTTPRVNRVANLRQKYGMTTADYEEMFNYQGGVCALCRVRGRTNKHGRLSIDHCHATGRIRGLLCPGCNSSLGVLGDTPERLRRALDYVSGTLAHENTNEPAPLLRFVKKSTRAA